MDGLNDKEKTYRQSMDELTIMRKQVDELSNIVGGLKYKIEELGDMDSRLEKLTGAVENMRSDLGRMTEAMIGSSYNPEGIVSSLKKVKENLEETQKDVADVRFQLNKKDVSIKVIIALAIFIATWLGKSIIEFFTKKP